MPDTIIWGSLQFNDYVYSDSHVLILTVWLLGLLITHGPSCVVLREINIIQWRDGVPEFGNPPHHRTKHHVSLLPELVTLELSQFKYLKKFEAVR